MDADIQVKIYTNVIKINIEKPGNKYRGISLIIDLICVSLLITNI